MNPTDRIDTLLDEQRSFPPPPAFRAAAYVRDGAPYRQARADREAYWAAWARELDWFRPWDKVLDWRPPRAQWFVGGKLNASVNCLDRHLRRGNGDKVALVWEGEPVPPEVRRLTYAELHGLVNRFANVLKDLGVARGARVGAHRRDPHRRLRRILRRLAARPHQRRRGHGAGDGRRRVPPGRGSPAQA